MENYAHSETPTAYAERSSEVTFVSENKPTAGTTSAVWSCNEWDPLEEVIVGNPLNARFPTPDPSTRLAEFPDRALEAVPRGPFPRQIIEETEEDLSVFVAVLSELGVTV